MNKKPKPFYTYSPIESSFIIKASWYTDAEILAITFTSGSIWMYYDVSYEVFMDFMRAKSHGSYFNKNIRNAYFGEKISQNIPELISI
jgi:hypothetical protein